MRPSLALFGSILLAFSLCTNVAWALEVKVEAEAKGDAALKGSPGAASSAEQTANSETSADAGNAARARPSVSPSIGAYIEAAYHANPQKFESDVPVPLRIHDTYGGNNFILHAAHLTLLHQPSDVVNGRVELEFGQDAGMTSGFAAQSGAPELGWFDLQEAVIGVSPSPALAFSVGKFATDMGIEVLQGPKNPTITRGFLFGFAEPFTHVGVKAAYRPVEPLELGFGVVNGWDAKLDNNDSKTVLFRFLVEPNERASVALSGTYGAERSQGTGASGANDDRRLALDMTGSIQASPHWVFNFQANYGAEPNVPVDIEVDPRITRDAQWVGLGVQPWYHRGRFLLGMRWEWFHDPQGVRALPTPGAYMNFTLTPGFELEEYLMLRGEVRLDTATRAVLTGGENTQTTFAFGATYSF